MDSIPSTPLGFGVWPSLLDKGRAQPPPVPLKRGRVVRCPHLVATWALGRLRPKTLDFKTKADYGVVPGAEWPSDVALRCATLQVVAWTTVLAAWANAMEML
eukprot:5098119-Pyramimonas_sp.AAC.1